MIKINIFDTPQEMGKAAAQTAIDKIVESIERDGQASIVLATGTSQFDMLQCLVQTDRIDWSRVTMFHLDEYIGIPQTHKASFRRYLKERFLDQVACLNAAYLIQGDAEDPKGQCQYLAGIIREHEITVTLAGIGENGHLAFNDPPADFNTVEPFLIVDLDEKCRMQQVNEGWFNTIDEVPTQAVSMSIKQIMNSKCLILCVPDSRKAEAVKNTITKSVSRNYPASIIRGHSNCYMYLDKQSAVLLNIQTDNKYN